MIFYKFVKKILDFFRELRGDGVGVTKRENIIVKKNRDAVWLVIKIFLILLSVTFITFLVRTIYVNMKIIFENLTTNSTTTSNTTGTATTTITNNFGGAFSIIFVILMLIPIFIIARKFWLDLE